MVPVHPLRPRVTSHAATRPRLRLGRRIDASPPAIRTLAATHPGTPLGELLPVASESTITCRVAPGWRATYSLSQSVDAAPVVGGIRLEPEGGAWPPNGAPATIWRRAVTNDALLVARSLLTAWMIRAERQRLRARASIRVSQRPRRRAASPIASTRSWRPCSPRSRPPVAAVSSLTPPSNSACPATRSATASRRPETAASSTATT